MALSKNAAAVLDRIVDAGSNGQTHFQLETIVLDNITGIPRFINHNTLRRITQELRSAGLISAVKMPEGALDRVMFVPTVAGGADTSVSV